MSTERRQVSVSRSRFIAPRFASQKRVGNSATAKCRSRFAAASNIFRLRAEAWVTVAARGAKTTMSSSGAKAVTNRESALNFSNGEGKRRLPSPFQPARKFAAFFQWQQSLRHPQRRRSRPRPRALQAYLAQMQFGRAEIRVRRIVLIQSADSRVAKEHATAPVGLQAVLMRIDHDGVRFSHPREGPRGIFCQNFRERKIASVRRIRMYSKSVFFAKHKNLRERIDRTRCRGTHCGYHCPNVAALRPLRQRICIHATPRIARHRFEWQLQNAANPSVCIVRLLAGENFLSRLQLSRNP